MGVRRAVGIVMRYCSVVRYYCLYKAGQFIFNNYSLVLYLQVLILHFSTLTSKIFCVAFSDYILLYIRLHIAIRQQSHELPMTV